MLNPALLSKIQTFFGPKSIFWEIKRIGSGYNSFFKARSGSNKGGARSATLGKSITDFNFVLCSLAVKVMAMGTSIC